MTKAYDFGDDPSGLELLTAAAIQLERVNQARAEIVEKGVLVKDRFGFDKENPALTTERAAANLFRLLVREMGLAPEASDAAGRPPRLQGRYL